MTDVKLLRGDMREESDQIEDGSVDLILTDPPYGNMKGFTGLDGWNEETTKWDDAIDPETIFKIAERILRKKGRLILFSAEPYTSELIQSATTGISFSYRCIWKKDQFGNPLLVNKAPVKMFEDIIVFKKVYSNFNNPLRDYFSDVLNYIGETKSDVVDNIGGKADHTFRVDTAQFSLCTEETYDELTEEYNLKGMDEFLSYEDLKSMKKEADIFNHHTGKHLTSTFNTEGPKSDIFDYAKPREGKHPTQKPVPLLVDLIETYTNPGDTVADLTMGSGSTGVAAQQIDRNFIGIELLEKYYEVAQERVLQKSIA